MNKYSRKSIEQVVTLEIDSKGEVNQRLTALDTTLENTLLHVLYPGIKIAVAQVPTEPLDAFEESVVANRMANIVHNNIHYKLVGASGSSKDGKFYFADAEHAPALAERFHKWPQAAIVYFGILVSPCQVVIEEPDATVLVVPDHVLGTNDCRGWIRRSLFNKLSLPPGRMYQFRLAFEDTQAKGSFKVVEDDAADLLRADIILPLSSIKPGLRDSDKLKQEGRKFRGRTVLGIREFSRLLEFESSYTLIEHAPDDSLQLEILPEAVNQVRNLNNSLIAGDYRQLLEILGIDPEDRNEDEEVRNVEAALMADKSGHIVRFPYVNHQLNRLLARWAYKASTSGGFCLPAFALADDGFLVAYEGILYSGSDWIPEGRALVALDSQRGLCVRYPIRMAEDLLPVEHMGGQALLLRLAVMLKKQGAAGELQLAEQIVSQQLQLEGVYVLHSETAKNNGGDFDFDWICVLEENRFPRFVRKRFEMTSQFHQQKTKRKARSPWWNLMHVAMKARGNQIGMITDLKTSCIAAGRQDLAYKLVSELQNALDNLKHDVEPDHKVINEIRQEITAAPWLRYKNADAISELPIHLDVASTDRIGKLYNHVRKEIEDLLESKLPIGEFKGLITGEMVYRVMFDECRHVNSVYAAVVAKISERNEKLKAQLDKATEEWEEFKRSKNPDKSLRREKYLARQKAYASHRQSEDQAKQEMKAFISWVRVWAGSKKENRAGWLQALHTVVCNGRGSGSILFHAFPQEMIDKLAASTGGNAVRVAVHDLSSISSYLDEEGRAFLVENT
ncbi:MAG TPA: hypothetical protein VFP59_11775, partial [Candidatus Angelobacter sp.]|nr:hypothetical protein [Candidatus Angelobacter sp.]